MKLKVVAVYDRAADAFGVPNFVAAIGSAIRGFTDEVNRAAQDNALHNHPEDFDIYELGEYDDSVGRFDLLDDKRLIARAQDLKKGA